jgi:hypothetical protein
MNEQTTQDRAKNLAAGAAAPLALGILAGIGTSTLPLAVGLGILAALVVGVITLQIQVMVTMERNDVEAQMLLRELEPIVRLSHLDEASGEFLLRLAAAQANYLNARPRPPALFDDELSHQQQRLLERYDEGAQGKMSVSLVASPVFRETDGISMVKKNLCATSLVPARTYWDGASGASYLRQQEGMLEAGISIKRVFIQPQEELEALARVMGVHLQWRERYGPNLLDVSLVLLDDRLDDDLILDFAVVDDSTVIRLDTAHGIDHPVAVVWESGPSAVAAASTRFERLWQCGHDPLAFPVFQELATPAR